MRPARSRAHRVKSSSPSYNHLKLCGLSALSAISMFSSQCTPSTRRCKLKKPAKQEVTARRTLGDENREGPDKPSRPPKDTVAKNMCRGANGLDGQSVGPPPSPPSFLNLLLTPPLYHTQHLSSTSCSWCLPRAQCAASLRNWRLADVDAFTLNQTRWCFSGRNSICVLRRKPSEKKRSPQAHE